MQVRVRVNSSGERFLVETRTWYEALFGQGWTREEVYDNLPRAMAVAEALKNPTIINIKRKKS